jgi:hypothetical protein
VLAAALEALANDAEEWFLAGTVPFDDEGRVLLDPMATGSLFFLHESPLRRGATGWMPDVSRMAAAERVVEALADEERRVRDGDGVEHRHAVSSDRVVVLEDAAADPHPWFSALRTERPPTPVSAFAPGCSRDGGTAVVTILVADFHLSFVGYVLERRGESWRVVGGAVRHTQ